jgi:ankyrin repeat protein
VGLSAELLVTCASALYNLLSTRSTSTSHSCCSLLQCSAFMAAPQQSWYDCAIKGDLPRLQEVLLQGWKDSLDQPNSAGAAALHLAAEKGHEAVVAALLAAGAAVDVRRAGNTSPGQTPLLGASGRGHTAVMQLLLDAGADVDASDASEMTPLLAAAHHSHLPAVQLLLESGRAEVDKRGPHGKTALMLAARVGHVPIMQLLLHRGASMQAVNHVGTNALVGAVLSNQLPAVMLLLNKGVLVYADADCNAWALAAAANRGHMAVIEALLAAGVAVRGAALANAAKNGHIAVLQALLQRAGMHAAHLLVEALQRARQREWWDAFALLVKALQQRSPATLLHMLSADNHPHAAAMARAIAAMAAKWVGDVAGIEGREADMGRREAELAEQTSSAKLDLQHLLIGVAGEARRGAAAVLQQEQVNSQQLNQQLQQLQAQNRELQQELQMHKRVRLSWLQAQAKIQDLQQRLQQAEESCYQPQAAAAAAGCGRGGGGGGEPLGRPSKRSRGLEDGYGDHVGCKRSRGLEGDFWERDGCKRGSRGLGDDYRERDSWGMMPEMSEMDGRGAAYAGAMNSFPGSPWRCAPPLPLPPHRACCPTNWQQPGTPPPWHHPPLPPSPLGSHGGYHIRGRGFS